MGNFYTVLTTGVSRVEWFSPPYLASLALLPALMAGCILNSRIAFWTATTAFLTGIIAGLINLAALVLGLIWVYCCASRGKMASLAIAIVLVGIAGLYDRETHAFLLELEVVAVWGLMLGCSATVPLKLKQERERTAERVASGIKMRIERNVQRTLHNRVARDLVHAIHSAQDLDTDKLRSNSEAVLRYCESALAGLKSVLIDTNAGEPRATVDKLGRCSETFWRTVWELESRLEVDARWDGAEDLNETCRVEQIFCEAVEELLFNAFKYADPHHAVKVQFSMVDAGSWTLRVKNKISQKPILQTAMRSRTGLATLQQECADAGLILEWGATNDWWNAELKCKK